MTSAMPFTEASIRRAINGARKAGLRVIGIRPDGTIMVADGDGEPALLAEAASAPQTAPRSSKWEDAEI